MKILVKSILLLLVTIFCQCKSELFFTQEKINEIDKFIKQQVNEIGFSGYILISEKNKILLAKGNGLAI